MKADPRAADVRYQPDENPPPLLSMGLGLQLALLSITGIVLTPAIVVRSAGADEQFLQWAVFAAVIVSGTTTIIQAVRVWRVGAGYVLLMGSSGAFIAACIAALSSGGPQLLATLIVISALFQFFLASRLPMFRRILTPTVSGTVIMLISVTVMPVIFGVLEDVPRSAPASAAPVCAAVTVLVIACMALKARGILRLWSPVAGVVSGSIVAALYGIYDFDGVAAAAWLGLPTGGWPGIHFRFDPVFWTLLPTFLFLTLIGAIETLGDSVAIQRVSWRRPRAVDFQSVQGAIAADGTGNLLSGLLGTVPNTTYSSSISMTELTGVAARSVGVAVGALFILLAFVPKALAVVLAVPGPVVASYLAVLVAMLFVLGMKVLVSESLGYRLGLIAGVSFWLGAGFEEGRIFPGFFEEFAGGLLANGMTAGGLAAILMTLVLDLLRPRARTLETVLSVETLPEVRSFLQEFARRYEWRQNMIFRMEGAAEEVILILTQDERGGDTPKLDKLVLTARKTETGAVLEFVGCESSENIQDRIAYLAEQTSAAPADKELSLRLLRHLASSVRHERYHDVQILTVHIQRPRS